VTTGTQTTKRRRPVAKTHISQQLEKLKCEAQEASIEFLNSL